MTLGSASLKAVCRTLVKLAPGVNITNILRAIFCTQILKVQKDTDVLNVYLRFWDLRTLKLHINMLVKLTPVLY
jgi:hypothetical protein